MTAYTDFLKNPDTMALAREKACDFISKIHNLKINLPYGLEVIKIYEEPEIRIVTAKRGFFKWADYIQTSGKLSFLAFNRRKRKAKMISFSDLSVLFKDSQELYHERRIVLQELAEGAEQ